MKKTRKIGIEFPSWEFTILCLFILSLLKKILPQRSHITSGSPCIVNKKLVGIWWTFLHHGNFMPRTKEKQFKLIHTWQTICLRRLVMVSKVFEQIMQHVRALSSCHSMCSKNDILSFSWKWHIRHVNPGYFSCHFLCAFESMELCKCRMKYIKIINQRNILVKNYLQFSWLPELFVA